MKYSTCDIFELIEDINCPFFVRRLSTGTKIRGTDIKLVFNLAWLNPESTSFTRFFKLIKTHK